jgi:broad specificity phosphatase PhoE
MNPAARFVAALSLSLAMLAPIVALAAPSAIYLARHGEKAPGGAKDPELTEIGQARARNIAAILGKAGVKAVFSTPLQRTRQTAAPLALAGGLEVQAYDPAAPGALVAKVKTLSGAVLVVGHSNTLTELVRLFGGVPGPDIADNEYDRLYQLIVDPNGGTTTVLLTSVPVTGAVP